MPLSFTGMRRFAQQTCSMFALMAASTTYAATPQPAHHAHGPKIHAPKREPKQNPGTVSPSSRQIVSPGPLYTTPAGDTHLFGDWGSIQPWLIGHGIHLLPAINEEFSGNITGGRERAYTDTGQFGVELDIDWDKLAGLSGFWTHTIVVNGHGDNLSRHFGDPIAGVQEIYGARGNVVAHLVALWGEQALFQDKLDISVGWIPPGSFFAASPLFCDFMNVAICGNPAPDKYTPGTRDWPSGNLGTVVHVALTPEVYIAGGLFAVSPHGYNGGISGWAWAQSGLGKLSTPVELGWQPSFGHNALVGHYKFGFSYDNSHYPHLYESQSGAPFLLTGQPARQVTGQNNLWLQGDQMLVRNGAGNTNGLIVLGGAMYSDGRIVSMHDHEWAGLVETGAAWGRPNDTMGAMFQHFDMSRSAILQQELSLSLGQPFQPTQWGPVYGVQSHENAYELFYSIHLMRATALQPDFQYIQRPDATTIFHDAAVLGVQITSIL